MSVPWVDEKFPSKAETDVTLSLNGLMKYSEITLHYIYF